MKYVKRIALVLVLAFPLLAALFVWNGVSPSWRVPKSGTTDVPASTPGPELRILAWNIAKCGFHQGGITFRDEAEVREQLRAMAQVIRESRADLVFLSEVVFESAPCPVNQVTFLAQEAGFHAWCYGDNYSWGLPGLRIRAGNAILSRFPLRGLEVVQLPGGAPFWNPTNNRRALFAEVDLGGEPLLCGSIRSDSFDPKNNARQAQALLDPLGERPALLAGDFNAEPHDESMQILRDSGRFRGVFDGPATHPADVPRRRIDTILVPVNRGAVVSHEVLDADLSDHEPVLVVLRGR